jgi:hypothetical protein
MTRAGWRTKRNTRTPTKAFDVSDVRKISLDAALIHELERVIAASSDPTLTER